MVGRSGRVNEVVGRMCSASHPRTLFSGWEYAVDVSYGVYGAIQKAYHLVRRRRWVRERLLKDPKAVIKQVRQVFLIEVILRLLQVFFKTDPSRIQNTPYFFSLPKSRSHVPLFSRRGNRQN